MRKHYFIIKMEYFRLHVKNSKKQWLQIKYKITILKHNEFTVLCQITNN